MSDGGLAQESPWRLGPPADGEVEHVAIGIGPGGMGPLAHVGILHKQAGEPLRFLHLAWHHQLCNEAVLADFHWVVVGLRSEYLPQIKARCRKVLRKNPGPGIPYGRRFENTQFAPDGQLVLGVLENGLTCATFVLSVFRDSGFPLVDLSSWPHRESDNEFRQFVLAALEKDRRKFAMKAELYRRLEMTEEAEKFEERAAGLVVHMKAIAGEPACARYQPEEVAAAASSRATPLSFEATRSLVDQLVPALVQG